ncbi:gamma-aminobutyric acid type B receptor subunit 2-like [Apostichopus japonicus]|uniref:gamma-aminobutyric acid type B receptor subunit 2-like n=1 Tax=Stichopus japonicus TaxID=307972 RepID=UPI003AB2A389
MRIFVVLSYEDASRKLFCQVYHQQLYGKGFVWVLPGWYSNQWWRKDKLVEGCTFDQLETAVVESMYISVEASNFTTSPDDDLIAGIKAKDYERELHLVRKKLEESGYDALWAVALALNKSQNDLALEERRLEDFTYDDNITGTVMFEAMESTIFSGVSGPVSFGGGDRKGDTNIEQLQGTCRSDWESFQFYCYTFVNESKDWQSARQFCRNLAVENDAYLVSVLSKKEIDFIRSSVLQGEWDIRLTFNSSYGRIVWVDTNEKNVTVEPNDNSEIDELATCPIWNISSNKWKSVHCKKKMPFICKMRPDFKEKLIVTLSQSKDGTLQPTWHSDFTWYNDEIPADRTPAMEVGLTPLGFAVVGGIAFLGILMALAFLLFNILARKHRFVKLSSPRLNNVIIVGCILVYLSVCSLGLNLDFQNGENRHFKQFCMLRVWLLSVGFVLGFGAIFSKTWRVYKVASLKGGIRPVKIKDSALFTKVGILLALDLVVLSIWQLSDPLRHKLQNIDLEHYVYTCDCQHAALWSGILFVYRGLILAFGVFIAWQTRDVTILALNDSKGIALCVYNTTVLCGVGVGTAVILADSPTVQNVFLSLIMNFCATFAPIVIFVPKIKFVYHHPHADRNISSTTSVTSLSQRPVRSHDTEPGNLQGYETKEGRQRSGTKRNIQKYQYKESPRSSDKTTDGSVATQKQTEEEGYSPEKFSKIASTLGNLKRHQRERSSTTNQE